MLFTLELLATSVEEYLDAIMWRPFLMFYPVLDCLLESICLHTMLKFLFMQAALLYCGGIFETPGCTLSVCFLDFCIQQSFDLVAIVVYHMITLLFSDENDGT
jgi:hypothetical protein